MEKPATLTPWTPLPDEPEPGDYLPMNDSAYRMKRSVSPAKRKVTSAVIAHGGINEILINGITPNETPKPERVKPKKKKKATQTTRPSKTASFVMSNYQEMK